MQATEFYPPSLSVSSSVLTMEVVEPQLTLLSFGTKPTTPVQAGDKVIFTMEVANKASASSADAFGVVLGPFFPSALAVVESVTSGSSGPKSVLQGGNSIRIEKLKSGQSFSVSLVAVLQDSLEANKVYTNFTIMSLC